MSIGELPVETRSISDICLIGTPQYHALKTLPNDDFMWVHGASFDVSIYTELARVYPDGILPDARWDFFRVVGLEEESLVHHEQSVQPLTFVGNVLPSHGHITTLPQAGGSIYGTHGPFWGGDKDHRGSYSASTSVVSAGKETAPRYLTWHCIMRVR